jgi:integrase
MISRGHWQALTRYRDLDGGTRRVTASGQSRQAAGAALQNRLRARRVAGGQVETTTTVSELAGLWLDQKQANQATLDAYRRTLNTVIVPAIGRMTLGEVTTGSVDVFLGKIASVSERKRARTILSQMFALAVRWDAVTVNPVRDASPVRSVKKDTVAVAVDELQRLRAHVAAWAGEHKRSAWVQQAVDVLVGTGIRPGELLGLQWQNIIRDAERVMLTVTGTVKRDSVNGLHRQPFPKSKAGQRAVILPSFAVDALEVQRARHPLPAGTEFVFPARGGKPMEPANFRRLWREVRGTEWAHVEPRSFRTAVATLIARESGAQAAADQLGHSSTAITVKHYIEKDNGPVDNTALWTKETA